MDPALITEFASERYFNKLRQLNKAAGEPVDAANGSRRRTSLDAATSSAAPTASVAFTLPIKSLIGNESLHQPEKIHKTRPRFGMLRTKRGLGTKTITSFSNTSLVSESFDTTRHEGFLALFFGLPSEIQVEIINHLSIPKVLNLRLASKGFYNLVASNESQIARYHVANTLPPYAVELYPSPDADEARFHHLCAIWHRMHVASKLSNLVAEQATKEIFLRTTELQRQEFKPQRNRMRHKLMRRVFTILHFFERYRELHIQHLASSGVPLSRQAIITNPFERIIFEGYSDDDLIKAHESFPLLISSFSRRLRPPSYAGRLEKTTKYSQGRPADEVYSTILLVGGLRQACFFWDIKGYNPRRTAVDTWYKSLIERSAKLAVKSQKSTIGLLPHFGRKFTPSEGLTRQSDSIGDMKQWCHPWYCVIPDCKRHTGENDHILSTGLSEGPPMRSLTKEELQLFLPDLPHLANIWIPTAEAVILERKIKESPKDIKRNTQVLLDLIRDDGTDSDGNWEDILFDQTIETPSSKEELHRTETASAEQRPSAAEISRDAAASECTSTVEAAPSSDSGPRIEDMKPEDATHPADSIRTIEPGNRVQQTELPSFAPADVTHETTTAIEPEPSILELPKTINDTEKTALVSISRSSQPDTTTAESVGPANSEASHDNAIARNLSPADVLIDSQVFDSGEKPMSMKLMFFMARDFFFVGVYLLQQVLGLSSDTWSQIWGLETELPEGMSRVRWKCSCGALMYDDFIELRQGAADRLEKSLNEDPENNKSTFSRHSSNNSQGTLKYFSTTALKSFLVLLGLGREQPGLPQHEMHTLPGDSNLEGTNSTLPDPVWLLLCHVEGVYASKLAQIKVSDFDSDQKLFSALRNEYTALRGKWLSKISFRTIKDIKFVGFEVHSGELVDVRPEEDIPPIDNADYCYDPAPAELIPPVGHRHLMHLFQHPLHAQPKRVCYDRFPKKLRTRLACSDKPTEQGWGLHLVEGWSLRKIWISGFLLSGIGSLIFGIVWVLLMHSIQDAFTVAAYWLTFGMFSIGTLQAILHLN